MSNIMENLQDIDTAVETIVAWWHTEINADTTTARNNKTKLRHCNSPIDAIVYQATHTLHARLIEAGYDLEKTPDQLALIASCFANIDEHVEETAAELFGRGSHRPTLPSTQFDNIRRHADFAELIPLLRLALNRIDNRANVYKLARDLLLWTDRTRIEWTFDYCGQTEDKRYPLSDSIQ